MFGTKKQKYEKKDELSYERVRQSWQQDLRAHIRKLFKPEILSKEWFLMTALLENIASVALMEEKTDYSATDSKVKQVKKGMKDDRSLWDGEDLCIRYIIEEGKLNMLVRTLAEYKAYVITLKPQDLKQFYQPLKLDEDTTIAKMDKFESSLGYILKVAFNSKECLQTCDIPLLVKHIECTLTHATGGNFKLKTESKSKQEILIFYYLASLVTCIEQLNESQVIQLLRDKQILPLTIKYIHSFSSSLNDTTLKVICTFVSKLMGHEDFTAFKDQITNETKTTLVSFYESYIKASIKGNYALKKEIRALVDFCIRYK